MKYIAVGLEDDEHAAVGRAAAQQSVTTEVWVRALILRGLAERPIAPPKSAPYTRKFTPDPKPSSSKKRRK